MSRLGVHKRWSAKFVQRELDVRVPEYSAKLSPAQRAGSYASGAVERQRVERYADGDVEFDLVDAFRLTDVGRRGMRKALADMFGRREAASLMAVRLAAWEMFLSNLLKAGRWRCTQGLPRDGCLLKLQELTEQYSIAMSLGWVAQADKLHHLVFGIEPVSSLWYPGYFNPKAETPREPWGRFTLALLSQFYGHPLPPRPPHPYESPAFDALVAVWRDPDPAALVEPLLAVCDWHTHECMYKRSDRESKQVDFINDVLMGWPVEVHTVFRLRERLGLALPPLPDHPLMQTPMAPYLAPQPVPMDDRLRRVCQRGFAEVPGLQELLGDVIPA